MTEPRPLLFPMRLWCCSDRLVRLRPRAWRGRKPSARVLEGQPARVEEQGILDAPGYYRRVFVACPLHTLPGAMPCNTGPRQTGKLGVHEPLGYLGAWLAAGSACVSRKEHMALKPSDADTRAYALRNGPA